MVSYQSLQHVRYPKASLNPCCSGQWSNIGRGGTQAQGSRVLILIVVEDGLVHRFRVSRKYEDERLNPYCSGRWSRTATRVSGQWV